jgi:hypothetical protein
MQDQLPTLGGLSSTFQLVAGAGLAMSVFRAPYERLYQRLGAILDREEELIRGRTGDSALAQADKIAAARMIWHHKGREVEPIIRRWERLIWASIFLSTIGLIAAALWPNLSFGRWMALGLITAALSPGAFGTWKIFSEIHDKLSVLSATIRSL